MVQQTFNVGNESESGKLETILMHKPGNELARLRVDNLEELLFDEIPDIYETHQSHDCFTNYLRDHGVQVLYVRELLCATLTCSKKACQTLIDGIIANSLFNIGHQQETLLSALREWLLDPTPGQLVEDVISGVVYSQGELGFSSAAESLINIGNFNNEFTIPPLPNLLFTRDAFSVIEKKCFHLAYG
jgi:arginine deiminase